ncbi:MAG: MmcQ/YjbR family DNA-binding protein [Bacteroidales bacterium]|nr:MmcQ/YjbR family DNA-binding protein [Bacteroidales bacterium]
MNIEEFREYCLSLPNVTEDMPFDENVLVFRIFGKIFACISMENPDLATLKCNEEKAIELRAEYPCVEGAFHWNKKYWNQIWFNREVNDVLFKQLINHAYDEVWKKLPRKVKNNLLTQN